jgi:putative hydrolase of the HAD superfamily
VIRDVAAVVFDLDDTLHDDTRAEAIVDAYVDAASRYWRALGVEHLRTPIADSRYELWSAALGAVGISDVQTIRRAALRYGDCRRKHYRPFPAALELLAELRRRGIKLGLITNGFAETHYEKLELLGLERAFDAVLCADEVGMLKPDPRIFLRACELLATPPERTAMVGDRYFRDIVGAREAGLFTVYLDVHAEKIPEGEAPDVSLKGIEEVLAALLP